ncbi:MAG TPA: hypothetical protein HPP80_11190 [Rhodospirillaceae bacterium]|nr:hypothetical protein [Rhodospirillaceae bacterium]
MIRSLAKALGQLPDPRFRRVLWRGLGVTLVFYLLLYLLIGWGLHALALFGIGWVDQLTALLGGIAALVLTILLFPGIVMLVLSFLLDDIAQAVELRYYPQLPPPRQQPWFPLLMGSARFALASLVINLVALPIDLLLLFTGLGLGLYYLINGYLLSRQYFELAAWRRLEPKAADRLRRAHAGRLLLLGLAIAGLSTIPLINLLAPLIGAAAMVHEVEALRIADPAVMEISL